MKKEQSNEKERMEKGEWKKENIKYPIFNIQYSISKEFEQGAHHELIANKAVTQTLHRIGGQGQGFCRGFPLSTGPPGRARSPGTCSRKELHPVSLFLYHTTMTINYFIQTKIQLFITIKFLLS